mmetsp:Transcript_7909/g.15393  ORF Transcript_7909/g.15393 Transcript_7909/m.15393 type:complete len:171 (-) Transcript_7909:227-739(-)
MSSLPFNTTIFTRIVNDRTPRRELSQEEQDGIVFAFETLDAERTGYVTPRQLKVALRALGFEVKKADVMELLKKHGEGESDFLDFNAFRMLVSDKLQERTQLDEYRRAFQLFDVFGSGAIDAKNLKKVVKNLNLEIQDTDIQEMIREFDLDRDGEINEQEFISIMASADE